MPTGPWEDSVRCYELGITGLLKSLHWNNSRIRGLSITSRQEGSPTPTWAQATLPSAAGAWQGRAASLNADPAGHLLAHRGRLSPATQARLISETRGPREHGQCAWACLHSTSCLPDKVPTAGPSRRRGPRPGRFPHISTRQPRLQGPQPAPQHRAHPRCHHVPSVTRGPVTQMPPECFPTPRRATPPTGRPSRGSRELSEVNAAGPIPPSPVKPQGSLLRLPPPESPPCLFRMSGPKRLFPGPVKTRAVLPGSLWPMALCTGREREGRGGTNKGETTKPTWTPQMTPG